VTETTRWIKFEERLTEDQVRVKAEAWIAHMNKLICGFYRLLECRGRSGTEKAGFQVIQTVPKRMEPQKPFEGPVTETLRWIIF
jgi:hypothetical protein